MLATCLLASSGTFLEPNPPAWPSNVYILDGSSAASLAAANSTAAALYARLGTADAVWTDERAALLLKPGTYPIDVPVGYYTQVVGLGASSPEQVVVSGPRGVHHGDWGDAVANSIVFWRGVENLRAAPTRGRTLWSVSQAAPMRRVSVHGNLTLGTRNNTQGSGGFIADARIDAGGVLDFTMQQQWLARGCELAGTGVAGEGASSSGSGSGISYFDSPPRSVNFVFVGCSGQGVPADGRLHCTDSGTVPATPSPQLLVEPTAPVSVEKPFITWSADSGAGADRKENAGKFSLVIPQARHEAAGPSWTSSGDGSSKAAAAAHVDDFERVFVATNVTSVEVINAKLAAGLHVVLCPGIYSLGEPIRIGGAAAAAAAAAVAAAGGGAADEPYHQTLLGLGLATLIPTKGTAAVVARGRGARIAGLLLQAGPQMQASALLQWVDDEDKGGAGGSHFSPSVPAAPGLLSDVYARVGGPGVDGSFGAVGRRGLAMVEVNASCGVVLDNVWLWRGDIGAAASQPRDVAHGLVVNGADVVTYGLAAEHVQSDNVVWNGERGRLFFYQAELDSFAHCTRASCIFSGVPFDDGTPGYGPDGVSGYRVNAREHDALGVGVYVYQVLAGVVVEAGVKVRHEETLASIICPFQWVFNPKWWGNWNSTIQTAIAVETRPPPAAAVAEV